MTGTFAPFNRFSGKISGQKIKETTKMTENTCLRCGHRWSSVLPLPPASCAKCKSKYWHLPKRLTITQAPRIERHRKKGPAPKYPFHGLEVGQSVLIEWARDRTGYPDEIKNTNINKAVRSHAVRTGREYIRTTSAIGLTVRRIK